MFVLPFRLSIVLLLCVALPVAGTAEEHISPALAECVTHPAPLCVLDLARSELNHLGTADSPPDSQLWSEDMKNFPDLDVASDAWRIVWDVYGKAASTYVRLGRSKTAEEVFDGIEKPEQIASRLQIYSPAIKDKLDKVWLARTLSDAADASFPFGKPGPYLDSFLWSEVVGMAAAAGERQLLERQLLRFEEYAKSEGFAKLSNTDRDQAYAEIMGLILLLGDIDRAHSVEALIVDPEGRGYARMQIGEWLARQGKTSEALRLAEGMNPNRRDAIVASAATYLALNGYLERARELLAGLDETSRAGAIEAMVTTQGWQQAKALSTLLELGGEAHVLVAIVRLQIDGGNLEDAAATARKINEVGERAVAFGILSLAASRHQRKDLVLEAKGEVMKMRSYNVDLTQIADAETVLLYALANLDGGLSASQKTADVRELLDGITPAAFPEDPMESLGAPEARANLLIQLAGAQFALGLSHEARKSIDAVIAMGGSSNDTDRAFVLSEAAGLAFSLTGSKLGEPAVQQALAAIFELKYPMDRAMMLVHLAETMTSD
jgi:tetratricopeptide (TPR) repeat protein